MRRRSAPRTWRAPAARPTRASYSVSSVLASSPKVIWPWSSSQPSIPNEAKRPLQSRSPRASRWTRDSRPRLLVERARLMIGAARRYPLGDAVAGERLLLLLLQAPQRGGSARGAHLARQVERAGLAADLEREGAIVGERERRQAHAELRDP